MYAGFNHSAEAECKQGLACVDEMTVVDRFDVDGSRATWPLLRQLCDTADPDPEGLACTKNSPNISQIPTYRRSDPEIQPKDQKELSLEGFRIDAYLSGNFIYDDNTEYVFLYKSDILFKEIESNGDSDDDDYRSGALLLVKKTDDGSFRPRLIPLSQVSQHVV